MIADSPVYRPDPDRAARTHAGSVVAFDAMLRRSREAPDAFWAEIAAELDWIRPWETVREGHFPHFKYFVGGISNPTLSLLDRHLSRGDDNRLALIWEGEDGQTRFYTYRMLALEVNRCANVLKRLGVAKGDAVGIFTPNLAEAIVAVLACLRIGALFNTVFSGFSARSLRDRLEAYEPKVVITADGACRRGQVVPLKATVDEAIEKLASVEAVVVIRRTGTAVPMREGRDHWWQDLMAGASSVCPPEPMEANEPGIVFYTSGTTGKPKGIVHSGIAFVVNNYLYARYHLDLHPWDVLWCTADIGWLTLHIWGIVGALSNGITTIVYEGALDYPTPDRFYQLVDRYQVTKLFTAPTALRMLMRHGEALMAPFELTSLDVVAVVGEPLNPEAWHWTYEKLGRKRIYLNNTWGQTELAGCPLSGAAWLTPMKPGSCGPEFFGASLDIVDDAGRPVGTNVSGNLVIRRAVPDDAPRSVEGARTAHQELLLTGGRMLLHERRGGARRRRALLGHWPRGRHHQRGGAPPEHDGNGERHHGMRRRRRGGRGRHAGCREGHGADGVRHPQIRARRVAGPGAGDSRSDHRQHQQDRAPGARVLHRYDAEDTEREDHAPAAEGDRDDRRGGLRRHGSRGSIRHRSSEGARAGRRESPVGPAVSVHIPR